MSAAHAPQILRYSAFAATPEGGNPAGVVLDAEALEDADMLRIATEVGYSETAFVGERHDAGGERRYAIRYWSPNAEVPFCGHATVASAVVLAERDGTGTMTFQTQAGDVTVEATRGDHGVNIAFTSVEPDVRDLDADVLARTLALFGLDADDLDSDYPAREAYAGNWHPMIVLRDAELFHQFRFSPEPVARLMREQGWSGTITVLHRQSESEFLARNIFPVGRITEDPATGSAAAATGAYLRAISSVPADGTVRIHQGSHVGRPSLLTVQIPPTGGITVTGGARPIPPTA